MTPESLLFYAARHASQADVTIVSRTEMFSISAISVIFLHEKLTKIHIPAMLLAFIGAFIAANPSFNSSFLPLLAAFGTAMCDTIAYSLLSYFSDRVNPITVVMYFCTFSTIVSIPLMAPTFIFPTGWNLFCLLMIGITAAIGQITMTFAYHMLPAGEMSIYNQLAIVFSAVLGFFFLHETPSLRTLVGGILVLFASLLLFLYQQHNSKEA